MATILVTGGTGFIGSRLVPLLAAQHEVISLARTAQKDQPRVKTVRGTFHSFEDLRRLDGSRIEALVHLAGVTGGCSEQDGLEVNVAGTRRLLRYLADRGCRKFVLASSVAAVGCLTDREPRFAPQQLPIAPDHPFLGRDAYGLSKVLMENMARYMARAIPDAGIVSLRFGAVTDEEKYRPEAVRAAGLPLWAFVTLARVALRDVLRGLILAVSAPLPPGYRQYNLVGPDTPCEDSVPDLIPAFLGPAAGALDLAAYRRAGHGHDPLYSMKEIKRELGFAPEVPMRRAEFLKWQDARAHGKNIRNG